MGARQNVAPAFETYYYPNSFAEAVAADLAEAGLFNAVDYVGREPVDGYRYVMLYTSSAMVYGRGGAFSFNLIPPPSDSKVDRRSLFSWHFEVLRRAMLDSKDEIAEALSN